MPDALGFRTLGATFLLATLLPGQQPTHWTTFFGGSGRDAADRVAVGPSGEIFVAGTTDSADLPVPASAFQSSRAGAEDVFVARIAPDGSSVLAATYLGGTSRDMVYDLTVASDGSVWLAGKTSSSNFPTTPDAFSAPTGNTNFDAFVANLDAGLTTLRYATALGGVSVDNGNALVLDEGKSLIYVAGTTNSASFPTTSSAYKRTPQSFDAFLAILDRSSPGQTSLAYGTVVGGGSNELALQSLSVDAAGVATLTGTTFSSDFPVTPSALQASYGGNGDAFIARIDPSQPGPAGLVYGSYLDGTQNATSLTHVADANGVLHLLLASLSPELPTTPNALISSHNASLDVYYAQLDPTASGTSGLLYASWIVAGDRVEGQGVGNAAHNICADLALAPGGVAIWVTTSSQSGVPTTPGAFQPATTARRGHALWLDLTGPDPAITYATSFLACSQNVFTGEIAVLPNGDFLMGGWGDGLPVTAGAFQLQAAGGMDGYVARLTPAPWPNPVRVLGSGCPGSGGMPTLSAASRPRLCKSMSLQVTGLARSRPGFFFFGPDTQWKGLTLPISLTPLGSLGCDLHVGLDLPVARNSNSIGEATLSLSLPLDPGLLGKPFGVQFASLDPGVNPLGLVTSNGLGLEARW